MFLIKKRSIKQGSWWEPCLNYIRPATKAMLHWPGRISSSKMSRKDGKCAGTYLACSKHGEIPAKAVRAHVSALGTRHCSTAWAKGLAAPSHQDQVQLPFTQQATATSLCTHSTTGSSTAGLFLELFRSIDPPTASSITQRRPAASRNGVPTSLTSQKCLLPHR